MYQLKSLQSINPNYKISFQLKNELKFSSQPIQSSIKLKCIEGSHIVPTFCFISSIISMFRNPILMKKENTIYHREEYLMPNSIPVKSNSLVYDDIHTSEWFSKSHKKSINSSITHNDTLNILCPASSHP